MSMARLNKLIDRLEDLPKFIIDRADDQIRAEQKSIVEQNKKQMREQGITFTEEEIAYLKPRKGPTGIHGAYSDKYEKYKSNQGGNVMYVDLYATGVFHKSIQLIQTNPGNWSFVSYDEKFIFLLANYGNKILGVTEEFLDTLASRMQGNLQNKINNYLSV